MPLDDESPDSPIEANGEANVTSSNDSEVKRSICSKCGQPSTTFCPRCGQDFCQDHKCIMHDQTYTTESAPLIDEDGVKHQGRSIRLIGEGWPNSLRMIKDMADDELKEQIKGLQTLLQDAVRTGDYARISIAAREYELDYREHSRYVAAMKRREKLEQGAIRVNAKRKKGPSASIDPSLPADIQSIMKAFNISADQAKAMKIILGGQAKP